jgi:hypothetical protein
VAEDPADHGQVVDQGNNFQLGSTSGTSRHRWEGTREATWPVPARPHGMFRSVPPAR